MSYKPLGYIVPRHRGSLFKPEPTQKVIKGAIVVPDMKPGTTTMLPTLKTLKAASQYEQIEKSGLMPKTDAGRAALIEQLNIGAELDAKIVAGPEQAGIMSSSLSPVLMLGVAGLVVFLIMKS